MQNTKSIVSHRYNTRSHWKMMENDHQAYIKWLELMYRESNANQIVVQCFEEKKNGEMSRAVKEKNHLKEDLESLKRDYVALNRASKSWRLGKSLVEWRTEVTTLENKLHQ